MNKLSPAIKLYISAATDEHIGPFAPELPITTHVGIQVPFWSRTTLSVSNLIMHTHTGKGSFKPYQNEHDSIKEATETGKKRCNVDLKIPVKIWFHHHVLPSI